MTIKKTKKEADPGINKWLVFLSVFFIVGLVLVGSIIVFTKPKFTGFAVIEGHENQTDCEGAGYTWEILTEENCTTIPDCVECVEGCGQEEDLCVGDCVLEYTEVLCEEGCNETCVEGDLECVVCEEGCVLEYTEVLCIDGCVQEEDLCEEDCQETCQNCSDVIIGGQCVGDVCDFEHLVLCLDEVGCVDAGGYWYDDTCNSEEECISDTCESLSYTCGSPVDGCGGNLDCGSCDYGHICTGGICEEESSSEETENPETIEEENTESAISIEESSITGAVTETICTPDWQCEGWNECIDGQQSRGCTDANGCDSDEGKPSTSQSCTPPETCSDGIKNQDEREIDCGGVCEERCGFFTIVGNAIKVPINSSKQFFTENKTRSFLILGAVVFLIGGLVAAKIFLLKGKKLFQRKI